LEEQLEIRLMKSAQTLSDRGGRTYEISVWTLTPNMKNMFTAMQNHYQFISYNKWCMKTNTVSISALGVLVIAALLMIGILKIQQVHARVDATSSDAVATSTNTVPATDATTSTGTDTTTTEPTEASSPVPSDSVVPTEPAPQGLTEVHIIGTKYIDYFTDGTTTTAYSGDPDIDSHFSEPNAPIPTRQGLTWVHTTGGYLYDTPTGDLEVGDYALQPNGSYIEKAPPFVSSTSTPEVLGASTSASDTPTDTSSTPTTTPAPTDITTPATTSEDSTTPPVTIDSASDTSQVPATATTTDTPSI
jgi:hypothetical protein